MVSTLDQEQRRSQDLLLIKTWLSGKSIHTQRNYFRVIDEFISWLHPRGLRMATLSDLQMFIDVKSHKALGTKGQRAAILRSLFSFAQKTGYLQVNFGAFIPGVRDNSDLTKRYLSEEEVMRIVAVEKDDREDAIIRIFYSSGIRVSELVSLNWDDLTARDHGEVQLAIRGKGGKLRQVRVSKATYEAMLKIRREGTQDHEPIFGSTYGTCKRLADRTVREMVARIAFRAGIKKRISPHWLRHCHASHAMDRGAPPHLIQTTLGHASLSTTVKYCHSRPGESSGKYLAV